LAGLSQGDASASLTHGPTRWSPERGPGGRDDPWPVPLVPIAAEAIPAGQ